MAMFVSILFKAVETQRKTLQIKFFFQYPRIQDPDTKESERNQSNWFSTEKMYFIGKVHSLQYLWVVSYQVRVDKKGLMSPGSFHQILDSTVVYWLVLLSHNEMSDPLNNSGQGADQPNLQVSTLG